MKLWDRAGESPQMRPHFFLDGAFLLFFLMPLQPLNNFLRLLHNCLSAAFAQLPRVSAWRHSYPLDTPSLPAEPLPLSRPPGAYFPCAFGPASPAGHSRRGSRQKSGRSLFYLALQSALSAFFDAVFFHRWGQDLLLDVAFYRPTNIFQLLMNFCILSSRNRGNLRRHILFNLLIDLWAKQILCSSNYDPPVADPLPHSCPHGRYPYHPVSVYPLFSPPRGRGQLLHNFPDNCGAPNTLLMLRNRKLDIQNRGGLLPGSLIFLEWTALRPHPVPPSSPRRPRPRQGRNSAVFDVLFPIIRRTPAAHSIRRQIVGKFIKNNQRSGRIKVKYIGGFFAESLPIPGQDAGILSAERRLHIGGRTLHIAQHQDAAPLWDRDAYRELSDRESDRLRAPQWRTSPCRWLSPPARHRFPGRRPRRPRSHTRQTPHPLPAAFSEHGRLPRGSDTMV